MTDAELRIAFIQARISAPEQGTYQHSKTGKLYAVTVADYIHIRESDLVPCIAYRSLATGVIFSRPISEFTELVTLPDGTTVPRFTRVP